MPTITLQGGPKAGQVQVIREGDYALEFYEEDGTWSRYKVDPGQPDQFVIDSYGTRRPH